MHIDLHKQEDGTYLIDGTTFEDEMAVFQTHMLDFCGCGSPETSMRIIHQALQLLKNKWDETIDYNQFDKSTLELFGSEGIRYFFWYVFDDKGLTDHGGSVPGWLTDKGSELLDDLTEYFNRPEEDL